MTWCWLALPFCSANSCSALRRHSDHMAEVVAGFPKVGRRIVSSSTVFSDFEQTLGELTEGWGAAVIPICYLTPNLPRNQVLSLLWILHHRATLWCNPAGSPWLTPHPQDSDTTWAKAPTKPNSGMCREDHHSEGRFLYCIFSISTLWYYRCSSFYLLILYLQWKQCCEE